MVLNQVRVYFTDGSSTYTFPYVQSVSDPKEGIKSTVIPGTRSDGSIVIPGGKKSQNIIIRGLIVYNQGYISIMSEKNQMQTNVTTNPATLSMQHWNGSSWIPDWTYSVIRTEEITFEDSLRFVDLPYSATFLVLSY